MATALDPPNFSTADLDRPRCLELLRSAPIGRVVLSVGCIPVAVPVNLSVLEEDVVFCTDTGSKLDAAVHGQVLSIEVDDIDLTYHTGWSVLVTGIASVVTDAAVVEWASSHLLPWAPGPHPFLVKVPSTSISGRCLTWDGPRIAGTRA